MREIIGINSVDAGIGSAGVGFVVVPKGINADEYIRDCYRTNTVTINGGRGYGYFSGVHVDEAVMQNITFPTDEINRGTAVIWVKDAISQMPIIVGSLRKHDDFYKLEENQFRMKRSSGEKNVEIFADANDSLIDISIIGDEASPAEFKIKLSSPNSNSVLNISSDNEITLESEKLVKIISNDEANIQVRTEGELKCEAKYKVGKGFDYKDEFGNTVSCTDEKVEVVSKQVVHNSGKESMVLGDTLEKLLDKTLNAIIKLTVPTALGPSGTPINKAEFQDVLSELKTILSKKSKLE